ncbi:EamA family transporter [Vibrio cholerae]|nr:EamA family transporter [Vibrio cholerae]
MPSPLSALTRPDSFDRRGKQGGHGSFLSFLIARRVDVLLLLVAVVWGSSYLAAKTLTDTVGVTVILSLRFLITTAALIVIALIWNRHKVGLRESIVGVVLGLTQAAVLILETHGIAGTSATNAGLIISLVVVFTPVAESIAFRVKPPRMVLGAGVIAVVGVCLLVSEDGSRPQPRATL